MFSPIYLRLEGNVPTRKYAKPYPFVYKGCAPQIGGQITVSYTIVWLVEESVGMSCCVTAWRK